MAESIFDDKSNPPTSADLDAVLGKSASLLADIERWFREDFGEIEREWKFYYAKAGWTFALVYKKRRIFHAIPRKGYFSVGFTLGGKAVEAARMSDLPERILRAIEESPEYAEGRSCLVDVISEEDAAIVRKLALLKMAR